MGTGNITTGGVSFIIQNTPPITATDESKAGTIWLNNLDGDVTYLKKNAAGTVANITVTQHMPVLRMWTGTDWMKIGGETEQYRGNTSKMSWGSAASTCANLGAGWRLPAGSETRVNSNNNKLVASQDNYTWIDSLYGNSGNYSVIWREATQLSSDVPNRYVVCVR